SRDWSSDVCSSDLGRRRLARPTARGRCRSTAAARSNAIDEDLISQGPLTLNARLNAGRHGLAEAGVEQIAIPGLSRKGRIAQSPVGGVFLQKFAVRAHAHVLLRRRPGPARRNI